VTHETLGVTEILTDLTAKRPIKDALTCRGDLRQHGRDHERPEARAEAIFIHADSA
jgi:hypothetical protein